MNTPIVVDHLRVISDASLMMNLLFDCLRNLLMLLALRSHDQSAILVEIAEGVHPIIEMLGVDGSFLERSRALHPSFLLLFNQESWLSL